MNNPIHQFSNAMAAAGITPPDAIIADGCLHRFSANGKCTDAAGYYVLHLDGIPAGMFGCWRSGINQTWRADIGRQLTPQENSTHRAQMLRIQAEREREKLQRQSSAALKAKAWWANSTPATNHPYLLRKNVNAYHLRQRDSLLLIPLVEGQELINLQTIDGDGNKRFLSGGRVKGVYSPIGVIETERPVYICEGWATGATIHEETGADVVCAMNAGNLLSAGQTLRRLNPALQIIIAGDDDRMTDGNPGRSAAIRAAESLRCGFVLPEWPEGAPPQLSDFNDLQQWRACA